MIQGHPEGNRSGVLPRLSCRIPVLLAALGLLFTPVMGQGGTARLFDEANVLYQQEEYGAALEKYSRIAQQGMVSSALLFNIANCHYKLNQIGKAILYYERARRLDPRDEDITANLAIANQATADRIAPPPEFAFARSLRASLFWVPFPSVLRLTAFLYLAVAALIIVFIFQRQKTLRVRVRKLLIASVTLLLLVVGLAGLQWWDSINRVDAVIQVDEISAKSSPGEEDIEVFTIHEGTKVRIDQETEDWVEIVLPDGKVGWIPAGSVETI